MNQMTLTFPNHRCLPLLCQRTVRSLDKSVQSLFQRPVTTCQIRPCQLVILIALHVDLISTGAQEHRWRDLGGGSKEGGCELCRVGGRDSQLTCGRFACVFAPRRSFIAHDMLGMRGCDDCSMSGGVDFLATPKGFVKLNSTMRKH